MKYFAYGSNMDPKHMKKLCSQALFVDIAWFEDHRFLINSHGYATVKPDPESVVYGVLWDLHEEEEAALDEYEGVSQGYFRKDHLEVIQWKGENRVRSLIYISDDIVMGIPAKSYLESILYGARCAGKIGLPPEYIMELMNWKTSHTG